MNTDETEQTIFLCMHPVVIRLDTVVETDAMQHSVQRIQEQLLADFVPHLPGASTCLIHTHRNIGTLLIRKGEHIRRRRIVHVLEVHGAHLRIPDHANGKATQVGRRDLTKLDQLVGQPTRVRSGHFPRHRDTIGFSRWCPKKRIRERILHAKRILGTNLLFAGHRPQAFPGTGQPRTLAPEPSHDGPGAAKDRSLEQQGERRDVAVVDNAIPIQITDAEDRL